MAGTRFHADHKLLAIRGHVVRGAAIKKHRPPVPRRTEQRRSQRRYDWNEATT